MLSSVEESNIQDLERLAAAAVLTGTGHPAEAWERAYQQCLRLGDPARAARCAFWLAQGLLERGEVGLAAGWLARARNALDDGALDCVERGYLLVPRGIDCFARGELAGALSHFEAACGIGERFGDTDLVALARMGCGRALVALGDFRRATGFLDLAMVAVNAGETTPVVSGLVYCGAIEACQEMFDLGRALEWTGALSRWCDGQPRMVAYRGQCLVHRAEIMELRGEWQDALEEARGASERLAGRPAAGDALYRLAELHRLRGELSEAERAYRAASRAGHHAQPGLALLRLAQGRLPAAQAAIRRVLGETVPAAARARLLGAHVEIALAAGDLIEARTGAEELDRIAAVVGAPLLTAAAGQATGAVLLAEGAAERALPVLRRAWAGWRALDSPYQAARVRVLVGCACRDLGDVDSAEMDFEAARLVFERLGAGTDLRRLDGPAASGGTGGRVPLTDRERQVLVLVAAGMTNRQIGSAIVVSEHTVARHLQNIFTKLGVSSRTAASSYAHRHGLVGEP